MIKKALKPSAWSVGSKITAFTFVLVGAILAGVLVAISITTSNMLEERAGASIRAELRNVTSMVEMFDKAVSTQAANSSRMFAARFDGEFALNNANPVDVGGKSVPTLAVGGKALNLDSTLPDAFTASTGATATIFALTGDEFIRISTSLKKEDGERAVGTSLDRASPAYAALRAGSTYDGLATMYGKQFITQYTPVRDAAGGIVGALYVGVDVSANLAQLKDKIRSIKIGETGYFYVLNAAPGKGYGDLIVHPAKEGSNLLASRDADGREFIRQMLESKNGMITYPWQNAEKGETEPRDKLVAYTLFERWNWLLAGGTYNDEITKQAIELRNRYVVFGLVALGVFAILLYVTVRATISRPLGRVRHAAAQIADGDLTVSISSRRSDEIGSLTEAMNGISRNLSAVVGKVRDGAEQIANASAEISTGNLDLCARTEQQAASLATTASSMDQLTATVRQNADNARQANQLAMNASTVAQKGGSMVAQVIDTMSAIDQSSRKIADIISVIDGIAFQTNILALNAAVEAARAGEQGRGFAVVASEVRNLAQRSAAAAREIKDLITTSNKEVDSGSRLVQEAGTTMDEVLASVARVTDIMSEISAASAEQSSGIEHVNQSIGEMDLTTQQNAALVEEASAAAQAMQDQAAGLARAVRLFKLNRAAPAGAQRIASRRAAIALD